MKEERTVTIGENIRRIRKAKNMTMVTLAEKIGCDAALIRKYEIGERNPKRDRLGAIAEAKKKKKTIDFSSHLLL